MNDTVLKINNLTVDFLLGEKKKRVIRNLSLEIKNEIFAIMGETGCGKSVLAASILGLLPSNALVNGSVLYKEKKISDLKEKEYNRLRGKEIALVLQSSADSLNPLLKIQTQLSIPIKVHGVCKTADAVRSYSETLLKNVSLRKGVLKLYPFQLSGGMQHRILTALGLSCKPSVLILDEPTRGMDMVLRNEYASLIKSVYDTEKIAILFITHDLELAQKLSHRCALMHNGEIVEEGETQKVFNDRRSAYFRSLIAAMPKNLARRQ